MKKIISMITVLALLTIVIFSGNSYAASLDAIHVTTDKTTVRPGEEVKVTVEFGKSLGAYTFDVSYDDNIFEYVSAEGGTPRDTKDKVKVAFYDATGGSNPRTNMSVIFKAKSGITTSNPTEFTVTAEGLANADASENYDDITIPIVKNVTVEPQYIDYTLNLQSTGTIIKGQEKDMTLSYSSSMGRYYEHARLVAKVTTPTGASVKLTGTDESSVEHNIIESGWGDAQGYKIGGKDVSQNLKVKALFSDAGSYTITLKLIDRDNSDSAIAQQSFNFTVLAETPSSGEQTIPETTTPEVTTPENKDVTTQPKPTKLPKTGNNIYVPILVVLAILLSSYLYYNKRK